MSDTVILQALVSGMLALLGGFFGAWFTRRTEYEKWLRQQRSMEFAAFLYHLHEVHLKALSAIYSEEDTEQLRKINTSTIFATLKKYESVARLYMSKSARKQLPELTNELWLNFTVNGGPANRINKIKIIESDIQELIEKELG